MSKLMKIKEKLAKILAQFAVVKTDKAILVYDGDEDLVAGMNVFVENEDGERKPAEDGDYTTEDNKVIVVKDGKVDSIIDTAAEVDAEETPVEKPAEEPTTEEPVEVDGACGDEKLEEETPAEEPAKETEEDAIAEIRKEINELYKLVDSILDKIGETRKEADERLSKIEKMSAAKPAVEEIETTNVKLSATSDKRAKRIAEMNQDWRKL